MTSQITWYVARSSGLVAWALVTTTIVWGLLLATRVLGRRPTPAWLLSLHRFLGALAVAFVAVHVGAILLDTYTNFSLVNVLVPFTGTWHPTAVAWGIVAMYLLVAIEITSLVRNRMSHKAWHAVHLTAYAVFGLSTVHMLTAGTDVRAVVSTGLGVLLGTVAVFGSAALYIWRNDPGATSRRRSVGRPRPAQPTDRRSALRAQAATAARQPSRQTPRNTSATTTKVTLNA
jgi:DMSO/TMAO reductase YedYZ heme-binding membrane subunit